MKYTGSSSPKVPSLMLAITHMALAPSIAAVQAASPTRPSSSAARHERACQVVPASRQVSGASVATPASQPAMVIHRPTVMPASQPSTPNRVASCPPIRPTPTGA